MSTSSIGRLATSTRATCSSSEALMRSESWLRLMSGLVLVGVFAAGTLFGAGLMKWTAPAEQRLPAPPPHGGPIMAMRERLALTEAQLATLRQIMAAHQHELDAIA